jgi:hypothetical protein
MTHVSSREENCVFSIDMKLTTHLHLVRSVFMTWCLICSDIYFPVCLNAMLKLVVNVVTAVSSRLDLSW